MTEGIRLTISDTTAKKIAALKALPSRFLHEIARGMDETNEVVVGQIQAKRLSRRGPETLGVVTNRLRLSVRPSKAVVRKDGVSSAIGSNVVYAGAHEFGFVGNVPVRAHSRRVFATGQVVAVLNKKTGRLRKVKPKKVQTGVVPVRAHQRKMNIKARAPIQRGIEASRQLYTRAIDRAFANASKAV